MPGAAPRQVLDRLSARHPGRDDLGLRGHGLYRGRESTVAEPGRDLVVLPLEAERSRHPAAAGVHLGHLEPGPPERGHRRRRPDYRLLVTVAVEQRLTAVAPEGQREAPRPFPDQE